MNKTRDNHYVPQWYQKGFISERENMLCHLKNKIILLPNGEEKQLPPSVKWYSPTQSFYKKDLYTTFLGIDINDDIERKLFGFIDDIGSRSIKAFSDDNTNEWHKYFQNLFLYLDAQKLRTPKGLEWIRSKYTKLDQNQLMAEMQSIQTLNCTLWAEGVRELVSATDSDVKFIISDHPVTVYNYACPPNSSLFKYPNDPDISLKGSQTIFPLNKDRCLILTNLEYAKSPNETNPLEPRTNPAKMRQSFVSSIDFINTRKLTSDEVRKINYIIKMSAVESIASGDKEWLHPEQYITCEWSELKHVLQPPKEQLHRYGGELYVRFDNGNIHYQNAFGQTSKEAEFLLKNTDERQLKRNDECGCGSGIKYKKCCLGKPQKLRTSWETRSIRERNLIFCSIIKNILGLDKGKKWDDVRKELSYEQIKKIYEAYSVIWPSSTDIYSLLPKPDKKFRGIYSGLSDIRQLNKNALKIAPYFDEFLILQPFTNPDIIRPEFNPIEKPYLYGYQTLKNCLFMLELEEYIQKGIINIIPDPSYFDMNLLHEIMKITSSKEDIYISPKDFDEYTKISIEDLMNSTYKKPKNVRKEMLLNEFPFLADDKIEEIFDIMDQKALIDPLVPLKDLQNGKNDQILEFKNSPNYEMGLFLSQITGSVIVTDSESRWIQYQKKQNRVQGIANYPWNQVYNLINEIPPINSPHELSTYNEQYKHWLKSTNEMVISNNKEPYLISEKSKKINSYLKQNSKPFYNFLNIKFLAPEGGVHDTKIQRLLLKSSVQIYLKKCRSIYYVSD
ncbi:DUF4238 domain-containing protein [Providencia huaxiensis]|uniref:DUF4238 domain-containing protein n=1 Tax=Providencia TaxID=586 RepID=UPI0018E759E3|nr:MULTISPECIES: DUF4238 domain-containing protein [Providencia]QQE95051.1 DUF4238 domain-containing protein [Providencia rettgeri]QWJ93518.1 DUF4238 domain-containing protein [Providencia rettgeri]